METKAKGTWKNIIRLLVFGVIFVLLFVAASDAFGIAEDSQNDRRSFHSFYEQPKDSIDVIFSGASVIYRSWDTMTAWHDYGITSWLMATPGQPGTFHKYLAKEAQKTQTPKLYVMDMKNLAQIPGKLEGRIRTVADNMPISLNRFEAINYTLDTVGLGGIKNKVKYNISFYLYHNRWPEVLMDDLYDNRESLVQSTRLQHITFSVKPQDGKPSNSEVRAVLDPAMEENIHVLMDYIKEENLEVLFIATPFDTNREEREKLNTVMDILQGGGMTCLDLSDKAEEMGIDYQTDYYDRKHLNGGGSRKYTAYLSTYLRENYNLPDHRGDARISGVWDPAYENYLAMWDELSS